MTGYALRSGLSFCRIGDRFVFLDLPQDRYFCLGEAASGAFAALASGEAITPSQDAALRALESKGILEAADRPCPPAPCPPPEPLRTSMVDADATATTGAVLQALVERARCRILLRRRPLGRVLKDLQQWKGTVTGDSDPLRQGPSVAAAFQRAALLVSSREQCLATSLAVARQLLRRGVRPCLVLGVKLRPFQAHCWIQIGDAAVNDRIDAILPFTPIHVV